MLLRRDRTPAPRAALTGSDDPGPGIPEGPGPVTPDGSGPVTPDGSRTAGRSRTSRRRRAVQAAVLCCVLGLMPATWLHLSTGDVRTGAGAASVPSAPVALVFGAGLWDGEPSPYLAHRLDAAAALYERGKVEAVLVTGDNSREDYDEPEAMRAYLTERGVPSRRIAADYAGFDTWDSCTRASRVFGVRRALLVSQDFHIRRAVALCRAAGVASHGVAVREPRDLTWYAGGVREIPGAAKAAFDAGFTPDPHFLGPHEPGVERALADARRATDR